jgi:hypothetical protein
MHRLNTVYRVRSSKLTWAPSAQLYTANGSPYHPHYVSFSVVYRLYTRTLLVSLNRRHLFVTPCFNDSCSFLLEERLPPRGLLFEIRTRVRRIRRAVSSNRAMRRLSSNLNASLAYRNHVRIITVPTVF